MPPRTRARTPAKKPADKRTVARRTPRKKAIAPEHPYLAGNALVCGDNLDILRGMNSECVDLIYLDPPFNSNQDYAAPVGSAAGGRPSRIRGRCPTWTWRGWA